MWTQWTSETAPIFTLLSGKAKSYILYLYFIYKTMYTSGKKKNKLFCDNKVQRKRWKPANRILKSEIQPLMESGIHGCGIRNPQTWNPESTAWNPESKTLLDYLTWGELNPLNPSFPSHSSLYLLILAEPAKWGAVIHKQRQNSSSRDGNDGFHGFHGNMDLICCKIAYDSWGIHVPVKQSTLASMGTCRT